MTNHLMRRQFARMRFTATGAAPSHFCFNASAAEQASGQAGAGFKGKGIVAVTRGAAAVTAPPDLPEGKTWRYGIFLPFQIAPRKAAAFVNIRIRNGILAPEPVADKMFGDYEVGVDVIPFDSISDVRPEAAVVMSRNHTSTNPNSKPPGQPALMVTYPARGGFVPHGSKRTDGSPHPHAGTGFGIVLAEARELLDAQKLEGGRRYHDAEGFRYFEVHQLSYDGQSLKVTDTQRIGVTDFLPGWRIENGAIANAIPDGDDMLVGMVGSPANPPGPHGSGVMRWVRDSRWCPAAFSLVTGHDGSTEPSLIRDTDGSLLFCARGSDAASPPAKHDIRIWRSTNGGTTWTRIIHVRGAIAGGPISLNRAADGTPYIAANIYEVALFVIADRYRLPRDAEGYVLGGGWSREKLYLWPLNEKRTRLEAPLLARDPRAEFGLPPGGSIWRADHPSAATVQLADGKWHNVIGYRVLEDVEWHDQAPPPQTGAYLEEVLSAGEPIPAWKF